MSTDEKLATLRAQFLENAGRLFDFKVDSWCESPIERLLLSHMLVHGWECPDGPPLLRELSAFGIRPNWKVLQSGECTLSCIVQAAVDVEGRSFRVDFAFISEIGDRIAVELDGHDFHERTKEQARHDKSRDRLLATAGWRLLRFTGSEVYADPAACLARVRALHASIWQAQYDVFKRASGAR